MEAKLYSVVINFGMNMPVASPEPSSNPERLDDFGWSAQWSRTHDSRQVRPGGSGPCGPVRGGVRSWCRGKTAAQIHLLSWR